MINEVQALRDRVADLEAYTRDLELALGQTNATMAVTFRLPPSLNKTLGLLMSLPSVTNEIIAQRLAIGSDPKNIIFRLRNELKKWAQKKGVPPIEIETKRQLGYWIDIETKGRIREYLAETERALAEVAPPAVTPRVVVDNKAPKTDAA